MEIDPMADESVKKVLLIIADISGYTEFMVSSSTEVEHSQHIISQLIRTIIEQVKIPIEVAKLEGDAVFLYAVKNGDNYDWEDVKKSVGEKLLSFFQVFHDKLAEMQREVHCNCGACRHLDLLRLKILAHSGEALFYSIREFCELSGKDVILAHRLTKNSVADDEYILMTEPAYSDIEFPADLAVREGRESYEHFGEIKTLVHFPH